MSEEITLDDILWQLEKHPIDSDYVFGCKEVKIIYDSIIKLKKENEELQQENEQLKEINKKHRKLNEELREEIQKANDTIDTNIEMIKHLQTIINKAIEYAKNSGYEISNAIIIGILKGDSNE